jgi:hypothetical protein
LQSRRRDTCSLLRLAAHRENRPLLSAENGNNKKLSAQAAVVQDGAKYQEEPMPQKRKRKYSRSTGRDVEREVRRYKRGAAKTGKRGRGGKVKSRKQAIAIGLAKARKKGKRVQRKKS